MKSHVPQRRLREARFFFKWNERSHSQIEKVHLGFFHVLAIVNNAVMNTVYNSQDMEET